MPTVGSGELGTEENTIDRAGAGGGARDHGVRDAGEDRSALDDQLLVGDPHQRRDRHCLLFFFFVLL